MDDNNGELIATVVQNGRPEKGMPKFDLSTEQIASIATFIHSMPVGGRAATTGTVDPLVGDAKAGEAYFNGAGKCATCHSVSGDLAGIGAKYTDVRALQGAMLSGETRGGIVGGSQENGYRDPPRRTNRGRQARSDRRLSSFHSWMPTAIITVILAMVIIRRS